MVFFSLAGIFVALALRFDVSRGKESQYFKSAFLGYTAGLVLTIVVMNWFQAAQVNYSWPSVLSSLHVQLYPVKVLSCGYTLTPYHEKLIICYAHCAFSLHFCILYRLLLESWLLTVYGMEKLNRFVLLPCLILSGIMFLAWAF